MHHLARIDLTGAEQFSSSADIQTFFKLITSNNLIGRVRQ
jgi:hypothetical protein